MTFFRVLLVVMLVLVNYSTAAHAFAGGTDCAKHAHHGAKMDCCDDVDGKPACDCGCGPCLAMPALLLPAAQLVPPPKITFIAAPSVPVPPARPIAPGFHPPDLLS